MHSEHDLPHLISTHSARIAERWYRAIAHTTFTPLPAEAIRRQLAALTDRAVALLLAESFDERQGEEIGVALARLRFLDPQALRQTLAILGAGLVGDLPAGATDPPPTRLTALLGAVAAGYLDEARATILAEQEAIRAAFSSEREQLLGALQQSEARFRTIFADAAIGITLADLDGHPIECNPAAQRILGYSMDELRRMVFTDITHPDDVRPDRALFEALVAGEHDSYQKEKRYRHKDGHTVWCNLTASLIRDTTGAPQFTIGMIEDITARKRMEANLIEAQRRLAESRETERLRLARELHDSAVQHLLDINRHLAEERKRAGERHAAEVPITTVAAVQQKVQEVTAQLRDLVRELRPPGLEEFGLIAALEGYVADLQRVWPDLPVVALDMEGEDTTLPLAVSLPLFRAAQEALRNVLEHAQARHVTLMLRVRAKDVMLNVRDDGAGFAVPASLGILARGGHFGLVGIAERVALAGGEMDITSQPGEGTVMTVRIPMTRQGGDDGGDDSGRDRG